MTVNVSTSPHISYVGACNVKKIPAPLRFPMQRGRTQVISGLLCNPFLGMVGFCRETEGLLALSQGAFGPSVSRAIRNMIIRINTYHIVVFDVAKLRYVSDLDVRARSLKFRGHRGGDF